MELVDKFCHYLCVWSYRVLAYDHGLMSFVDVAFHSWPVVLVTNPKNALFLVPGHEPTHRIKRSTYIRFAYLFLFVLITTDLIGFPRLLESPWIVFLNFQDLESPGKWVWSCAVMQTVDAMMQMQTQSMHVHTPIKCSNIFFAIPSQHVTVMNIYSSMYAAVILYIYIYNNNNNNDRLTAFDPGQPG